MVYVVQPGRPVFPDNLEPDEDGLVAIGGDLSPDVLIEAYQKGIFPWSGEHPIPWFSPDPRLILWPRRLRVSRSLRKVLRRGTFEVRFDANFPATIRGCAYTLRHGFAGTWITPNMIRAYTELHRRGVAHSVETYLKGELVGGLYGLSFGRAFFGESMFSRVSNASKVALYGLCRRLIEWDFDFIDCQQVTEHLLSLGAQPVPRPDYMRRLRRALNDEQKRAAWA